MADVEGTCESRFEGVRSALSASLDSGADVGASVAVYLHGEPVVDIWGGYVDEAHSAPWEHDTLTNVWSTTKTMTFLCTLMLADRGQLDFHTPVATYWPEFADGGKEGIEVRHLMGHTSGLSAGTYRSNRSGWPTGSSAPRPWRHRSRGGNRARPRATTPSPRVS
jgi:CubicO group peptidase (beta-lactamase class C family)